MTAKKIAKKAAPAAKKKAVKKPAAKKTNQPSSKKTVAKKAKPKKIDMGEHNIVSIGTLNTIPVTDAIDRTQNWCDYNVQINTQFNSPGNDYIRAFFVQKEDVIALAELLKTNTDMKGCRFYLGMTATFINNDALNPASSLDLLMVTVMDDQNHPNGMDLVFSPNTGESLVYDFTNPCPSTCDFFSVLYHNSEELVIPLTARVKKNKGN